MALSVEVHFPTHLIVLSRVHGLGGEDLQGGGLGLELKQRHEALCGLTVETRRAWRPEVVSESPRAVKRTGRRGRPSQRTPPRQGPRAAIAKGFALMWANSGDPFLYSWI
jgi:hypothetical protein